MSRIVVTIATGEVKYGNMALNLCLSIKASDPDMQVGIIYTDSAIKGIEPLIEQHFDEMWGQVTTANPRSHSFQIKTLLYDSAEKYDEVLFLDADSIMLPGRKVSDYFDEQKDREFTIYSNDILNYGNMQRTRTGHSFFCDPTEAYNYWKLDKPINQPNTPFLPQTDGCFIYFKRGYTAKFLFQIAQDVYNNADFNHEKYKGVKLSEMCFNIACAKMGIWPAPNPVYRPVFMEAFGGIKPIEFIQNEYRSFVFAGVNNPSPALLAYYTKLANFYRDYHGVVSPEVRTEYKKDVPINIYWHICMINNWQDIYLEQFELLWSSKLYDRATKIKIGCVGKITDLVKLKSAIQPYTNKIEIASFNNDISKYEFPTLRLLKHDCDTGGEFDAVYIHTKGVFDNRGKHWRDYLNYYNITKWKDCVAKLVDGFDTCGVKFLRDSGGMPPHYSGTFFHARSEYIRKLPAIDSLDMTDRHQAEFWIGKANPRWASLCQKKIDHFNHEKFK